MPEIVHDWGRAHYSEVPVVKVAGKRKRRAVAEFYPPLRRSAWLRLRAAVRSSAAELLALEVLRMARMGREELRLTVQCCRELGLTRNAATRARQRLGNLPEWFAVAAGTRQRASSVRATPQALVDLVHGQPST